MKRSPITRKSWIKRGGKTRAKSNKNSRPRTGPTKSELEAARKAWELEHLVYCWVCGSPHGLCTHHIMRRGGHHWRHYEQPCNWFSACDCCHTVEFHNTPDSEQLAYKMRYDRLNYCLEKWLANRNENGTEYVTQSEVDEAVLRLFGR